MEAIQITMFDYAALDAETRIVVQQRTERLHELERVFAGLVRQTAETVWKIGEELAGVQNDLSRKRDGNGTFLQWLKSEFPQWSQPQAYRFINVYKRFEFINLINSDIAVSALYALAEKTTPEGARIEAIARAEDGEPITHGLARGIIHDHKYPAEPFEDEPLSPYEQGIADQFLRDNEALGLENVVDVETGELIDMRPKDDWYNRPSLQTMNPAHRVLHMNANQGGSNEWYTPAFLIEAARETMEKIDLDPASCDYANQAIKAETIYTEDQDGLTQPWYGCMWMNPPYGKDDETNRSNQERWLNRLIEEYHDPNGHLDQAIIILNAVTDRKWFARLWDYPLCFTGRVYFYNETITRGSPTHGSVIAYFGQHTDRFVAAFRPYGRIVLPKGWYNEVSE